MKLTIENHKTGERIEIESTSFRVAWRKTTPIEQLEMGDPEWFYDEWNEAETPVK